MKGVVELEVLLLGALSHLHNADRVVVRLSPFVSLVPFVKELVHGVDKCTVNCLSSCVFFYARVRLSRSERRKSQTAKEQASASVTAATMRLKSTVIGGSSTNFMADLMKNKKRGKTPLNERCARLRSPRNVRAKCSRIRFALFSINDKSINNLPLFVLTGALQPFS